MIMEALQAAHHLPWYHALSHFFGFDNLAGPFYGFWSGAGSDIGELTIVGGVVIAWHHLNCHEPKCKKIGRYTIMTSDGQHHRICKKHHPDHMVKSGLHTVAQILEGRR